MLHGAVGLPRGWLLLSYNGFFLKKKSRKRSKIKKTFSSFFIDVNLDFMNLAHHFDRFFLLRFLDRFFFFILRFQHYCCRPEKKTLQIQLKTAKKNCVKSPKNRKKKLCKIAAKSNIGVFFLLGCSWSCRSFLYIFGYLWLFLTFFFWAIYDPICGHTGPFLGPFLGQNMYWNPNPVLKKTLRTFDPWRNQVKRTRIARHMSRSWCQKGHFT